MLIGLYPIADSHDLLSWITGDLVDGSEMEKHAAYLARPVPALIIIS